MNATSLTEGLPGADLVHAGLSDLAGGRNTIAACLVRIARTRLSRAGLTLNGENQSEAELDLYRLLMAQGGDAYGRYNALIRELVSFERALDARRARR